MLQPGTVAPDFTLSDKDGHPVSLSDLRGRRVVYYSKPRAEFVTDPGPLDEEAIRKCFRGICHASSGCMLEVAQREVGTIFGDYERGRRYVQLARETIAEYWKP